ncbi:MAG TPA: hypothetical protein VGX03_14040 [Candidatus Binatia bacterium]|jgi:hypothetical protein|nr:hypothetical protein [Candidatus Binatia bacterium]
MKAVFALLGMIVLATVIYTTFIVRPLLPFVSVAGGEGMEASFSPEETSGARWVRGIVRYIDPGAGTVLLQTEKGTVELFASPQVLLGLTEGATVSAYIAADELATTVAT